jgi:iron(III) transport system substrate-binding protein
MTRKHCVAIASVFLAAAACKRTEREVVVYTSVDQPFSEPIFREFEKQSGIKVRAVFDTEETKSTGVVNRLIAEAQQPQADVFFSGDPVRPFLLIKRGLVQPYPSPSAVSIPPHFKATDGTWTGSAARARILLVNKQKVPAAEMPTSVRDLAAARWRGQTAIANPLFGTTTMHVAALFATWGEAQGRAFLDDLRKSRVRIASSNGEVKRLVAAGEVAFGLCDTDDAAEALHDKAPVEVVYPDQADIGTLVMPTAVVLLKGPHPETGRALVDWLVSPEVDRRMAQLAAHMPLRADIQVAGVRPASSFRSMQVDYARLGDEMEKIQPWLRQWAGL